MSQPWGCKRTSLMISRTKATRLFSFCKHTGAGMRSAEEQCRASCSQAAPAQQFGADGAFFDINGQQAQPWAMNGAAHGAVHGAAHMQMVGLGYLQSYEHMGRVAVACVRRRRTRIRRPSRSE